MSQYDASKRAGDVAVRTTHHYSAGNIPFHKQPLCGNLDIFSFEESSSKVIWDCQYSLSLVSSLYAGSFLTLLILQNGNPTETLVNK